MADPRPDAEIAGKTSTVGGFLGPLVFGRACRVAKEFSGGNVEVRFECQVQRVHIGVQQSNGVPLRRSSWQESQRRRGEKAEGRGNDEERPSLQNNIDRPISESRPRRPESSRCNLKTTNAGRVRLQWSCKVWPSNSLKTHAFDKQGSPKHAESNALNFTT